MCRPEDAHFEQLPQRVLAGFDEAIYGVLLAQMTINRTQCLFPNIVGLDRHFLLRGLLEMALIAILARSSSISLTYWTR